MQVPQQGETNSKQQHQNMKMKKCECCVLCGVGGGWGVSTSNQVLYFIHWKFLIDKDKPQLQLPHNRNACLGQHSPAPAQTQSNILDNGSVYPSSNLHCRARHIHHGSKPTRAAPALAPHAVGHNSRGVPVIPVGAAVVVPVVVVLVVVVGMVVMVVGVVVVVGVMIMVVVVEVVMW